MIRALRYVWATAFVLVAWWALALAVASPALPGPVQTAQELMANTGTLGPQSAISLVASRPVIPKDRCSVPHWG